MENMENMESTQEKIEKEIVQANFFMWNDAVKTGNPKKVAELYTEDATFLPTVSGEFKEGQIGAEEYFKHFLEKNPVGEIVQEKSQALGSNAYLHSGMYNFEIGPENDRQTIKARFSFVWKKNSEGEWKIIHHHSSMKPKE